MNTLKIIRNPSVNRPSSGTSRDISFNKRKEFESLFKDTDVPKTDSQNTPQVSSIEKISFNLSAPSDSRQFNATLRWMIYKIAESNKGITYVELKKILRGEYGIDKRLIDVAISSLTSSTLFNALTKWRNPKMEDKGAEIGIHIFLKKEKNPEFEEWMRSVVLDYPELLLFRPKLLKIPVKKSLEDTQENVNKQI